MGLSLYNKASAITNNVSNGGTLLGYGNSFIIKAFKHHQDDWLKPHERVNSIYGFTTDDSQISFGNSWDDNGAGLITSKFSNYLNSKAGQLAHGLVGGNFEPYIPTDEWTQQKLKSSSTIKFNLKFRSYYDSAQRGMTTSYFDILSFLYYHCSPNQETKFFGYILDRFVNLKNGASDLLDKLKAETWNYNGEDKETVNGKYNLKDNESFTQNALVYIRRALSLLMGRYDQLGYSRYNWCFKFQLKNKIWENINRDWIITSWTCTPSIQTVSNYKYMKSNNSCPIPLYVDFNISLETNEILSNLSTAKMFSPSLSDNERNENDISASKEKLTGLNGTYLKQYNVFKSAIEEYNEKKDNSSLDKVKKLWTDTTLSENILESNLNNTNHLLQIYEEFLEKKQSQDRVASFNQATKSKKK